MSSNRRIYPEDDFIKEIEKLKDYQKKIDELKGYTKTITTQGAVTIIGSSLYSKFGASHSDMVKGYEYFAAHGHNNVIMVSALESLIHLAKERIREKHL